MRKLLWGGAAALVLGAAGLYHLPRPVNHAVVVTGVEQDAEEQEARPLPRGPEVSDPLLEPIVVEQAEYPREPDGNGRPLTIEEAIAMALEPGPAITTTGPVSVEQPSPAPCPHASSPRVVTFGVGVAFGEPAPRPDAETGVKRMPYADEDTWLLPLITITDRMPECAIDPVRWLADCLGKLQFTTVTGEAEEAEVKEAPASGPEPPLSDTTPPTAPYDYHYHYPSCPYTGRCPAPYPQR